MAEENTWLTQEIRLPAMPAWPIAWTVVLLLAAAAGIMRIVEIPDGAAGGIVAAAWLDLVGRLVLAGLLGYSAALARSLGVGVRVAAIGIAGVFLFGITAT